jgi:hypothetical protein
VDVYTEVGAYCNTWKVLTGHLLILPLSTRYYLRSTLRRYRDMLEPAVLLPPTSPDGGQIVSPEHD